MSETVGEGGVSVYEGASGFDVGRRERGDTRTPAKFGLSGIR